MSRKLAEYLGFMNAGFLYSVRLLESSSFNPGVDIKLILELESKSKDKITQLGLDSKDTSGEELYQELKARFIRDNKLIEAKLKDGDPDQSINSLIVSNLKEVIDQRKCFAIKHSIVKKQLKLVPPKVLLKKLGYRSVDSMLKREPAAVILSSALLVESVAWKHAYFNLYKNLTPSDFEERKVELFEPRSTKKWQALSAELSEKSHSTVLLSQELGGLVMLPLPNDLDGLTSATLIFALEKINMIRIHSVFCKIQQVKDNFGEIMANASMGKIDSLALIAGQDIPWHIIQRFYNRYSEKFPIEIFEPHVQKEDIGLIDIGESLSMIHSSLEFWSNTDYLAFKDNLDIVSFNIKDVCINTLNMNSYNDRSLDYFRESLWSELILRYINQKNLEDSMVNQMDERLIEGQALDGSLSNPVFGF